MFTASFADAHRNLLAIFLSVNLFRNFDFTIFNIEKLHEKLVCVNYAVAATMRITICFRSAKNFYQHIQYLTQAIHFLEQML